MPAYNRESFIEKAVESIRSQTYPHWKLVIADDGSTDKTLSIAKSLARKDNRIEVIELNHSGTCIARNAAISRADSQTVFVGFLDSDDVWYPDALHTLVEALLFNKDCVGSHGIARIVRMNGNSYSTERTQTWPSARKGIKGFVPRDLSTRSTTEFAMLVYGNFVPIGATLVYRWVFDKIGQFNPNIFIYDDWDMWIRVSSLGPFAFVNRELYEYRIHSENSPKPQEKMFGQEKEIFSTIYHSEHLTDHQRIILKRGYRMHQLYHSKDYVRYAVKKLMRGKLASSAIEFGRALERVACALSIRPFD
jgi:glycosyltransferase involved in cell wall biosynthesis